MPARPSDNSYTFGDSWLAGVRLELLAMVFGETTERFLRSLGRRGGAVFDLGCGPGFTTLLLRDVLAPARLVGVDSSAAFVRDATERLAATAEVVLADVTHLPARVRNANLIFARFLLTHLADPAAAVADWLARLAPSGVLAVEEAESITTAEPTLGAYLDLQRQMLRANHNLLEIGPVLEQVARLQGGTHRSEVVSLTPPTSVVARMFAMNFVSWRTHRAVTELASEDELNAIESGLADLSERHHPGAPITWRLRQLQIQRNQSHR
jgi:trans-aconitate 2-methyltransferase